MADPNRREDDPTSNHQHQHHSKFPVSRVESPKDQKPIQYIRLPVFSAIDCLENEQPARASDTHEEILLTAWAVLLHKYTGSEMVSFAAFGSPNFSAKRKPSATLALEEGRACAENGFDRCDGSIVRYRVLENARLQDVSRVSKEPWTAGNLSRRGTVNTAVDLSGRLQFVSCGHTDEKKDREKLPSVHLGAHHSGIDDYVRTSLSLYFSILIMWTIEDETPFNVEMIQNT